jgi:hypothetical protein
MNGGRAWWVGARRWWCHGRAQLFFWLKGERKKNTCGQVSIGVFADLVQPIMFFFTLPAAID